MKQTDELLASRFVEVEVEAGSATFLFTGEDVQLLGVNFAVPGCLSLHESALTSDQREEVEKLVTRVLKREVKDGTLDDYFIKSGKSMLTQLFKALYQRRQTWRSELSLKGD